MKLLEETFDDNEKRLSQIERALVNLVNDNLEAAATAEKLSRELTEVRRAQQETDKRLDALELKIGIF